METLNESVRVVQTETAAPMPGGTLRSETYNEILKKVPEKKKRNLNRLIFKITFPQFIFGFRGILQIDDSCLGLSPIKKSVF